MKVAELFEAREKDFDEEISKAKPDMFKLLARAGIHLGEAEARENFDLIFKTQQHAHKFWDTLHSDLEIKPNDPKVNGLFGSYLSMWHSDSGMQLLLEPSSMVASLEKVVIATVQQVQKEELPEVKFTLQHASPTAFKFKATFTNPKLKELQKRGVFFGVDVNAPTPEQLLRLKEKLGW